MASKYVQYLPHETCEELWAMDADHSSVTMTCEEETDPNIPIHLIDTRGIEVSVHPGQWVEQTDAGFLFLHEEKPKGAP